MTQATRDSAVADKLDSLIMSQDRTNDLLVEVLNELINIRQELEKGVSDSHGLMIERLEAIAEAHGYKFPDRDDDD